MSGIALRLMERQDRRRGTGPLPDGLFRYVLATSWMHQLPVVALTIAVFLLEVVPLELQRIEIGAVVAFISGVGRLNDPWGDLVDYFRDANLTRVKFGLLVKAAASIFSTRPAG